MSNVHVIHKIQFDIRGGNDSFIKSLPIGANIVHVAEQERDTLTAWFRCDPGNDVEPRRFHVVGTGHYFNGRAVYHGTVLMGSGLVLHLMEDMR